MLRQDSAESLHIFQLRATARVAQRRRVVQRRRLLRPARQRDIQRPPECRLAPLARYRRQQRQRRHRLGSGYRQLLGQLLGTDIPVQPVPRSNRPRRSHFRIRALALQGRGTPAPRILLLRTRALVRQTAHREGNIPHRCRLLRPQARIGVRRGKLHNRRLRLRSQLSRSALAHRHRI